MTIPHRNRSSGSNMRLLVILNNFLSFEHFSLKKFKRRSEYYSNVHYEEVKEKEIVTLKPQEPKIVTFSKKMRDKIL